MSFFLIDTIKQRLADMKTISKLCLGAERHANQQGEEKPGAEHFMLAALDLPDGSARNVFSRLNIDPQTMAEAIKQQHVDALNRLGIEPEVVEAAYDTVPEVTPKVALYDTTASGQALMQKLYQRNKKSKEALIGAHVLDVVAAMDYGIAPRVLQVMGVETKALKQAIAAEC